MVETHTELRRHGDTACLEGQGGADGSWERGGDMEDHGGQRTMLETERRWSPVELKGWRDQGDA